MKVKFVNAPAGARVVCAETGEIIENVTRFTIKADCRGAGAEIGIAADEYEIECDASIVRELPAPLAVIAEAAKSKTGHVTLSGAHLVQVAAELWSLNSRLAVAEMASWRKVKIDCAKDPLAELAKTNGYAIVSPEAIERIRAQLQNFESMQSGKSVLFDSVVDFVKQTPISDCEDPLGELLKVWRENGSESHVLLSPAAVGRICDRLESMAEESGRISEEYKSLEGLVRDVVADINRDIRDDRETMVRILRSVVERATVVVTASGKTEAAEGKPEGSYRECLICERKAAPDQQFQHKRGCPVGAAKIVADTYPGHVRNMVSDWGF